MEPVQVGVPVKVETDDAPVVALGDPQEIASPPPAAPKPSSSAKTYPVVQSVRGGSSGAGRFVKGGER